MSYCKIESDTTRYYAEMDAHTSACEWVENGPVICPTCEDCNLIFATFERAPETTCGRCRNRLAYPWVNGKRAKWTGGVIMDSDKIEYPERDPDEGRD